MSHACSSFIGCICIFLCCVGQVSFDRMLGSKEGRFGISIVFADEGKRVRVTMNETSGRNEVEIVYVPLTRGFGMDMEFIGIHILLTLIAMKANHGKE